MALKYLPIAGSGRFRSSRSIHSVEFSRPWTCQREPAGRRSLGMSRCRLARHVTERGAGRRWLRTSPISSRPPHGAGCNRISHMKVMPCSGFRADDMDESLRRCAAHHYDFCCTTTSGNDRQRCNRSERSGYCRSDNHCDPRGNSL